MRRIVLITTTFYLLILIFLGYLLKDTIELHDFDYVHASFQNIFVNNIIVINKSILFSIITFGLYGILFLIRNAYSIAIYIGIFLSEPKYLIMIIPHGIFEIPMFILSISLSFKIILDIVTNNIKKNKYYLKILIAIELIIFFSAIIESSITPYISNEILF